ncbi:hypothetical protein CMI47_11305 [Candidatus Pacearchaeota archaeon]|nr:hypothetical protein [Candidatus Pacearchaeota archaeon]|tara:strand:- start:1763 stop:2290 length:528 start_codon:yes stop_codon:yes gene_type:complete
MPEKLPLLGDTALIYPHQGSDLEGKMEGKVSLLIENDHKVIHEVVVEFEGGGCGGFSVYCYGEPYSIYFVPDMSEVPDVLLEELKRLREHINDDAVFDPIAVRRMSTDPRSYTIVNKIDGFEVDIVSEMIEAADYAYWSNDERMSNGKWQMNDCEISLQCGDLTFPTPEDYESDG